MQHLSFVAPCLLPKTDAGILPLRSLANKQLHEVMLNHSLEDHIRIHPARAQMSCAGFIVGAAEASWECSGQQQQAWSHVCIYAMGAKHWPLHRFRNDRKAFPRIRFWTPPAEHGGVWTNRNVSNSLKSAQPQSAISARQADKLILETAGHVKQTHESDACHVFWALPGQGLQLCMSGSVELLGRAPIVKRSCPATAATRLSIL